MTMLATKNPWSHPKLSGNYDVINEVRGPRVKNSWDQLSIWICDDCGKNTTSGLTLPAGWTQRRRRKNEKAWGQINPSYGHTCPECKAKRKKR